jgi:hypothetical protein
VSSTPSCPISRECPLATTRTSCEEILAIDQDRVDRAGILPRLFLTEHPIDRIDGVGHGDTLAGAAVAILQCLAVEGIDETIDAFRATIDVPIGRVGRAAGR